MFLPFRIARRTRSWAGVTPPISSQTMSISGSSVTSSARPVRRLRVHDHVARLADVPDGDLSDDEGQADLAGDGLGVLGQDADGAAADDAQADDADIYLLPRLC